MQNPQEVEVRQGPVKVHRQVHKFANDDLERQYHNELETAQSCFLKGEFNEAMTHAGKAAKILPCAHIFGLLSAACDGLGHFERSLDFRLLQAFFSNDPVVWQELLHDCLDQRLFYKATVCLQRLSALEGKDAHRFRSLQIQLADLYIGLGEVRRGHLILLNLWKSSRYRDFEVFASLSSLFFQLGRWSSLSELVDCSLAQGFRQSKKSAASVEGEDDPTGGARARSRKRDRFMDAIHNESTDVSLEAPTVAEVKPINNDSNEFDFDEVGSSPQGIPVVGSINSVEKVDDQFSQIDLSSDRSKKNFLTLVNVQAELFNEQGKFDKALGLVVKASALLNVPVLELPPDLLLRYGVAYAYLGFKRESAEVFEHLLTTCPMSEYGDALYDAAVTLQNVGQHEEAIRIFQALRRFHLLSQSDGESSDDDDDNVRAMLDSHNSDDGEATYEATVLRAMSAQRKQRRQAERNALKTTEMALTFSIGKSKAALGEDSEAYHELSAVHKMDPHHVESRILLSNLVERLGDLESAENLLVPLELDDPCQKIVLSSELIFLLKRRERYFDACAVGVGFFELLLTSSGEEEGDRLSVVSSAASKKSKSSRLSLPTMNRATSAILPASALADMLHEAERSQTILSTAGWKEGSKTFGLLTPSQSIAASFRSFRSSASSVAIAKRGSLTSTIAGSRAATTIADGEGKEVDSKDTSALFSFRRKRDNSLTIGKVKSQAEIDKAAKKLKSLERLGEYRKRYGRDNGMSEGGGSVGDVADLEEMESMLDHGDAATSASGGDAAVDKPSRKRVRFDDDTATPDGPAVSDSSEGLPSLEEIAKKRFSDPQMAALFVECTASIDNRATSAVTMSHADEQVNPAGRVVVAEAPSQPELIRLIGKAKIVDVAVAVIDCYAKLGKFTEGKEFAAIVMSHLHKPMFRNSSVLELPIRLAMLRCALDGNSTEDATRMAIQVLSMNESRSASQRNEIWEMLSRLHQIGDRTALLHRLMTDQGRRDVPLLVILGSKYLKTGNFRQALNFFLIALSQRSYDPILNFLVGIAYLFVASMRVTSVKHECVTAGLFYLKAYREFVAGGACDDLWSEDPLCMDGESIASLAGMSGLSRATSLSGCCPKELRSSYQLLEADYNVARAFHYLSLMYLAVPMYEGVLKCGAVLLDRHAVREATSSLHERQRGADFVNSAADSEKAATLLVIRDIKALLQLTRVNLYLIFGKSSDNYALALSTLESYP